MNRCLIFFLFLFFFSCKKESNTDNWTINDFKGSFINIPYNENLIREYGPGIYEEGDIPDDIKQLAFGRIEIDFRYDGGGLNSFMPLFYYGSINKNDGDNETEEPKFHMAIEVGHYNVIPQPVEYLFYTISTYRQPQYCRDTNIPMISGENYTMVIDKRPEGIILQLKRDDQILNIFPHAFFPDSTQLFFKDVTSYIDKNKGDSLKKILMVGKGFVGFDKGIHQFNGLVSGLRIFKYTLSSQNAIYEMQFVRNQLVENQLINFIARDINNNTNVFILMTYEFWPYKYESGVLLPDGPKRTGASEKKGNNQSVNYVLQSQDIGFYKINLQTIDENGLVLGSTLKPFEVWVYPKDWDFEFY
jgi:hypothetical protein